MPQRSMQAHQAYLDRLEAACTDLQRAFDLKELLIVVSADGIIQRTLGSTWETLLGWHPETLRSQSWLSFLHPEDRALGEAALGTLGAIASAATPPHTPVTTVSLRFRHSNGKYLQLLWRLRRDPAGWLYATGEVLGEVLESSDRCCQSIEAIDIIQCKQAEEALRQSEARNQALVRAIPDLLVWVDGDGNHLAILKGGNVRIHNPHHMHVGGNVLDALPPQQGQERLRYIRQALETKALQVYEYQITVDGDVRDEEARIIPDGENEVLVIVRDITEQRTAARQRERAERKLRQSQAALATAQRITHIGSWEFDLETQAITWSEELFHIFGMNPTQPEPTYAEFLDTIYPQDLPLITEAIARAVTDGIPYTIDHRIVRSDGSVRYLQGRGEAVFGEGDRVVKLVGTGMDITERKHTEEQLKTSLEEKELLLKEVHHRVKNNLQVISSLFDLQAMRTQDEQLLAVLQDSQDRIRTMALIHEQLYQSDRLDRVNFGEYMRDLAEHSLGIYQARRRTAGAIQTTCPRLNLKLSHVWVDLDTAIPCGLVVNELITNTLKHAFIDGREGELEVIVDLVATSEQDMFLELIVRDNGIGLPADVGDRETNSLGLRLVRSLVTRQLRGTLVMENQGGAVFRARIPIDNKSCRLG